MPNEHQEKPQSSPRTTQQEKQCRICYDSDESDPSLGRLFKPCLCAGTISVSTLGQNCEAGCVANYPRARAQVRPRQMLAEMEIIISFQQRILALPSMPLSLPLRPDQGVRLGDKSRQVPSLSSIDRLPAHIDPSPPVVVGLLSSSLFVLLVMLSSYVTSYFLASIEEQSMFGTTYFFVSPIDVAQDLVRAAIRILRDQDILPLELEVPQSLKAPIPSRLPDPPGLLGSFVRRFLLGLPIVGVGSLIHMILTLPFMGPLQWVARWRGNRTRRGTDRDLAAAVIVIFIVIGAARSVMRLPVQCQEDSCYFQSLVQGVWLYSEVGGTVSDVG